MGRGTYLGGSTLIGRRSGWVGADDLAKPGRAKKRRTAREKKEAEAAARKARKAKALSAAPKPATASENRSDRRMAGVEVLKRTRDGTMIVLRQGKAKKAKSPPSTRPRLRLRTSAETAATPGG